MDKSSFSSSKINRRHFIEMGAASTVLLIATDNSFAASNAKSDYFGPIDFSKYRNASEPYLPTESDLPKGRKTPPSIEFNITKAIIDNAPTSHPLSIARYFDAISSERGIKRYQKYAESWDGIYNPIIIEFFRSTKLDPLSPDMGGDETAWCAAFANWCLNRAGFKGTGSASSGSFRCFGDETKDPRPGDYAVWKKTGADFDCKTSKHQGAGHVAIVTEVKDKVVYVIGGNQYKKKITMRRVDDKNEFGPTLKLHSYRRIDWNPANSIDDHTDAIRKLVNELHDLRIVPMGY